MKKLLISIISLVIITFAVQIFVTNYLAIQSTKLGEMRQHISLLEDQNAQLKRDIATASSFQLVSQKALSLGFQPTEHVVAISPQPTPPALAWQNELSTTQE